MAPTPLTQPNPPNPLTESSAGGRVARPWRRQCAALALLAGMATGLPALAQAVAFRSELVPLVSVSLNTQQFLAGTTEGAPTVTIAGELRLPVTTTARVPAVVLMHGDAGQIANQLAWIDELNALGVAVFSLDSFSGRGAVSTGASLMTMPESVSGAARVVDAERALALLARHPRIDASRIALMGFSSGGRTAMVAAQSRFAAAYGSPGLRFAAFIALYPDCNVRLIDDTRVEPGPLRIFIGEADVLSSAEICREQVKRLRDAGADAELTSFAGAHHGFDNVSTPKLNRVPEAPVTAQCRLDERSPGRLVNADTGKPFSMTDACVGKGLIAGYDAAADKATKTAVKALLTERFNLR